MKKSVLPILLVIVSACSKPADKDEVAPVLTLNAPTDNQAFTAGQNIMISGTASDNKYIEQIHVVITNQITGVEYLHIHIHPNSNSFNFNQGYTAQAGINYKIEVIVDDPSSNSTAKSVLVSCN